MRTDQESKELFDKILLETPTKIWVEVIESYGYKVTISEKKKHRHDWKLSMDGGTYICSCGAWK